MGNIGNELHKNHRKRLKAKAAAGELSHWHTHELLELLLFYSIPRGDTNPTAHHLLERFGTLSGIVDASMDDLCCVSGVGPNTALYLKVTAELMRRYYQEEFQINRQTMLETTAKLGKYCTTLFVGQNTEQIYVLYLDRNSRLLGCDYHGEGDIATIEVDFRRVMEGVFRYHASNVVLSHNHPGALATPSARDIEVTNYLSSWLEISNVTLADHIVVSHGYYTSMREAGYLAETT